MKKYGDILLKTYSVSEEKFDEILLAGYTIKIVADGNEFYNYKFGYPEKTVIVYDGLKCMIMLECVLNEHIKLDTQINYWKQCIVYKNIQQEAAAEEEVRGIDALKFMTSLFYKYYTKEEYQARLNMFQAHYNESLAQYHFLLLDRVGKITRYNNCYKWDINGAHNDALCEIFPKAAAELTTLYKTRKQFPQIKKYVNYYVGLLTHGHRGTYNWIVQRTTNLLLKGIELADGDLLYANTDGFIVQNPKHIIPNSTALGEYKLEYSGPVWIYHDKNYQCFQLESGEIKGTILKSVRDDIDLPNNKVVHYDIYQKGATRKAINITTEVLANGR